MSNPPAASPRVPFSLATIDAARDWLNNGPRAADRAEKSSIADLWLPPRWCNAAYLPQ